MKNTSSPMISIIMPLYNAERFVGAAINSVLGQSCQDFELLIIDDGSRDNSVSIVREYANKDERIHLLINEQNRGVSYSRNLGVAQAKGQWIAFLDSDDIWHPEKLASQISLAEQSGAGVIYTAYALIDEAGKQTGRIHSVPSSVSLNSMLKNNSLGCSTVLLLSSVAKQHPFAEHYYHEDYVLWLRLLHEGIQFSGLNTVLVDYRVYSHSKAGNKWKSAGHRWRIYRDYLGLSALVSAYYWLQYVGAGLKKYRGILR